MSCSRLLGFSIAAIFAATIVASAQAVTIATDPVGYAGNLPDPATAGALLGAVPYNYQIGTYDVTNAQYVAFLNAKASVADPFGLWNSNMDPSQIDGAISRTGSGPYSYSVRPGYANKPVVNVSWYDAARFVNWLQNGQGDGDTESGTYAITGGGPNSGYPVVPDVTTRTAWANTNSFHWLLPSDNEWYKATYYNSSNGTYYAYPFQSNSPPDALAPPGNANAANFRINAGFAGFVYPAYNYDGCGSYLTDVGAYPSALSPFGSFDMGGDVFQWTDDGTNRGLGGFYFDQRGGGLYGPGVSAIALANGYNRDAGFRVANIGAVPEPSTALLAALACGVLWLLRARPQLSR